MTDDKILIIGSLPDSVLSLLGATVGANQTIVIRENLAEALPDLANNGVNDLGSTTPYLRGKNSLPTALKNVKPESEAQPLFAHAEFPELVGRSEKFRDVCRSIGRVATTDSTVLVDGESGTGKELVARAIHIHSKRAGKPFIKVNCAAMAETLIESELFGHVKGAFTGAVRDRKGRFAEARGGTILLDEIGSMPPASQAKFLRVLQEKEFEPVGSSKTIQTDVRVIATVNFDLGKAVAEGTFREDLYYRLSVFPIVVPPLRERSDDIPLLAQHFLRKYSHLNREVRKISSSALESLSEYHWPGNVRQLENAIQHALIVERRDSIQSYSLPFLCSDSPPIMDQKSMSLPLRDKLNLHEKQLLEEALAGANGKKKDAAALLGIHPKNLSRLLRKHDL